MKRSKQWQKPQVEIVKLKKTKKSASASQSSDVRFGLGPLSPPSKVAEI